MDISINLATKEEWNEFVNTLQESTFYHQYEWKDTISEVYGYKPYYMVGKERNDVVGILPLFLGSSLIFGKRAYSIAFGSYGGPIGINEKVRNELIEYAIKVLNIHPRFYEFRLMNQLNGSIVSRFDMGLNDGYATSILPLRDNEEDMLMYMKKGKRKMIRRALNSELKYQWTNNPENFYSLYFNNMHRLGSPVHSLKFFKKILSIFPQSSKVMEVSQDQTVIYGAFYLLNKKTIINSWSSTLEEYRKLNPTDFGIWSAIAWAIEKGYDAYDFGRSEIGSGNLEFKRRWNTEYKQLYYYYYPKGRYIDIISKNKKRGKFEKYWVKVPKPIAKYLGPKIRKNVP